MVHSIQDLKSGKLKGVKRLKLACGLETFPDEIFTLADSLEILDLSDNHLTELPERVTELSKLKIIFFANNDFQVFPRQLSGCQSLSMIGFKSNQIEKVPEEVFPPKLRWLILTDNKIKRLPVSIGRVSLLQKCALAGNLIEELPKEMSNCKNLELLRISANQLKEIPTWLFQLPKLSWVAFSGNPCSFKGLISNDLEIEDWSNFELNELLGEGASGVISKAKQLQNNDEVAIKVFKGDVTSDGWPSDEMEISTSVGDHIGLIPVLAKIKNHPEKKEGLIMKLISSSFYNLGNPPNFETCTRDTFEEGQTFSFDKLLKIAIQIASVCVHLHKKGINHGDLYAHNTLIDDLGNTLIGDFGAASFYDLNSLQVQLIEKVEVRAFGCLLEDLVGLCDSKENNGFITLLKSCFNETVDERPSFKEIYNQLEEIQSSYE